MNCRRAFVLGFVALLVFAAPIKSHAQKITKYCRFIPPASDAKDSKRRRPSFGIVEGDKVRAIKGNIFRKFSKTDRTYALKAVRLIAPTSPRHVFAMAGNYKSHLNDGSTTTIITTVETIKKNPKTGKIEKSVKRETEVRIAGKVPKKFQIPQPFFKSASSIIGHNRPIIIPKGATVVHYEAEMVIVIGKRARNVSKQAAKDYVFGVTIGNDVSARKWQKGDVQWWRAKGSDTFGPTGPYIVSGLNYDDLLLQLRLNNETKQKERTSQLIHNVASCVSFISQHVTLRPGDLIFTGTSGKTSPIKKGDVIEVELEGVGVLRNTVTVEE